MLLDKDIQAIIAQKHNNPFSILGPKLDKKNNRVAIRVFLPQAISVKIIASKDKKEYVMNKVHTGGFFEVVCNNTSSIFDYEVVATFADNKTSRFHDPYSFDPVLTDYDLHLIKEGTHYKTYEKLGAHLTTIKGIAGTYFALWAPNASAISVIGDFNGWDPKRHMMRLLGKSGIWEIFIPNIGEGILYKYKVNTPGGYFDKTDPYGFYAELSPQTGSIVYEINNYTWNDADWMQKRAVKQSNKAPISIYEVHLGSWKRKEDNSFFSYRELAPQLVSYVKDMGYTHIELLPVLEHPFYGSWGYQTIGYYSPTSRYGAPKDFMYFIDYCHQHDIGVILDWVPAHFPKDAHGLCLFDGTHLYEHSDPRQREHLDWKTFIYNYGRYEVCNFLISNALFWLDKYHIDGLRVDAVTSMLHLNYSKPDGMWIPNKYGGNENLEAVSFLQDLNNQVEKNFEGTLVIAEESTSWPGVTRPTQISGLGFDMKWNMGWMNDILRYMGTDPIYRKYNHSIFPFCLWYAFNEKFVLVLSHDEVVHGKKSLIDKMSGDYWQKFANLRLLFGFMYGHPGKKMLFMGGEFAQWQEWNHDKELDWGLLNYESHRKIQSFIRDLNLLYKKHSCLHETDFDGAGFEWCDYKDADYSVIAFIRKNEKEKLLFIFNYTPIIRRNYKLGINYSGKCEEIFNSDAEVYGGSNVGNMGEAQIESQHIYDKERTLTLTLPPLGMLVFVIHEEKPIVIEKVKTETTIVAEEQKAIVDTTGPEKIAIEKGVSNEEQEDLASFQTKETEVIKPKVEQKNTNQKNRNKKKRKKKG